MVPHRARMAGTHSRATNSLLRTTLTRTAPPPGRTALGTSPRPHTVHPLGRTALGASPRPCTALPLGRTTAGGQRGSMGGTSLPKERTHGTRAADTWLLPNTMAGASRPTHLHNRRAIRRQAWCTGAGIHVLAVETIIARTLVTDIRVRRRVTTPHNSHTVGRAGGKGQGITQGLVTIANRRETHTRMKHE